MDERADDEVAAIEARWRGDPPGEMPDARAMAAARDDVAALLDEIARLRLHLDALTPPAKGGMEGVPVCCEQLGRYLVDPDNVVDYWAELDQFLLPVRGGTRSGIVIAFCPWCGSPVPVPARTDKGVAGGT